MRTHVLALPLAAGLLLAPAPVAGQTRSVSARIAAVAFGYLTSINDLPRSLGRGGIGAGATVRLVVSEPGRPQLHLESGILVFSTVRAPCINFMPSGGCAPRREPHGLGVLRGAMIWPLGSELAHWYAGFGVAGYFPFEAQRAIPSLAGGLDVTVGSNGVLGSEALFFEARVGYMAGDGFRGGTVQGLIGLRP